MHYTAETMLIRSDDDGDTGVFAHVTPQRAEWQYLHMTARRLNKGMIYKGSTSDYEFVHVILGGECSITTSAGNFAHVGRRRMCLRACRMRCTCHATRVSRSPR